MVDLGTALDRIQAQQQVDAAHWVELERPFAEPDKTLISVREDVDTLLNVYLALASAVGAMTRPPNAVAEAKDYALAERAHESVGRLRAWLSRKGNQ